MQSDKNVPPCVLSDSFISLATSSSSSTTWGSCPTGTPSLTAIRTPLDRGKPDATDTLLIVVSEYEGQRQPARGRRPLPRRVREPAGHRFALRRGTPSRPVAEGIQV